MKGDWVIEYKGKLLNHKEASANETRYSLDSTLGCFMFYFKANEKSLCLDATTVSLDKGRMMNHSMKSPSVQAKVILHQGKPRVVFLAKRDIQIGEEIVYDYGDRSPQTLEVNPWLKT